MVKFLRMKGYFVKGRVISQKEGLFRNHKFGTESKTL